MKDGINEQIEIIDLIENWFYWKEFVSDEKIFFLFRKFIYDYKNMVFLWNSMPNEWMNSKGKKWKDIIYFFNEDSRNKMFNSFWNFRIKNHFSRKAVSNVSGIDEGIIEDIEDARDNIHFNTILQYANKLKHELFFGLTKDLVHVKYTSVNSLKELGLFYKHLRNKFQWSFKRLSDETGLSIYFLKRIEHGNLNPDVATMRRITKAYGYEIIAKIKQ